VRGSVEDNVEVAFTVSPSARRIRFHEPGELDLRTDGIPLFFSSAANPWLDELKQLQDSMVVADRIHAGGTFEAPLTPAPGNHMLMVPASHAVMHVVAVERETHRELSVDLIGGSLVPATATKVGGAGASEIVLSDEVRGAVGIDAVIAQERLQERRGAAQLKGIEGDVPITRLREAPSTGA
jgi:hypothetical protein